MTYRNDLEAAHARIEALEQMLEQARAAELRVLDLEAKVAILQHEAERAAVTASHQLQMETAHLRAELEAERHRVAALERIVEAQEELIKTLRSKD